MRMLYVPIMMKRRLGIWESRKLWPKSWRYILLARNDAWHYIICTKLQNLSTIQSIKRNWPDSCIRSPQTATSFDRFSRSSEIKKRTVLMMQEFFLKWELCLLRHNKRSLITLSFATDAREYSCQITPFKFAQFEKLLATYRSHHVYANAHAAMQFGRTHERSKQYVAESNVWS